MRYLMIVPMLLASLANADAPDRVVNRNHYEGTTVIHRGETPETGSGNRIRQMRPAGEFTRVIADDAMDVEIRIGPRASIEIEGDDNLIDRVSAEAEKGTLHLRVRGSYRVREPMVARITVPQLERVDLEASGNARISGLDGGRLALAGHGSGSFEAEGAVDEVDVRIQGSGDARLDRLRAEAAHIVINGSGNARAHVTGSLVATVNGTGDIIYLGRPRAVAEDVNGTGRISRAD